MVGIIGMARSLVTVMVLPILAGLPVLGLVATGGPSLVVLGVALFVLWVVLVAVVTSAPSVVHQTVRYRSAVGRPTGSFGAVERSGAFRRR